MGSTRLPGKVLHQFCGAPLLQFQIELISAYNLEHNIVVATTSNDDDREINSRFMKKINTKCFVGSQNDVFDRFCNVAEHYKFDQIIRLTANINLIQSPIN